MLSSFTGSYSFAKRKAGYFPDSGITTRDLYLEYDSSNTDSFDIGDPSTWYNLTRRNSNRMTFYGGDYSTEYGIVRILDGVNDYFYPSIVGADMYLTTAPRTLQVWVKYNSISVSKNTPIFTYNRLSGTLTNGFNVYIQTDRSIVTHTVGTTSTTGLSSSYVIVPNVWYLMTFVYSASNDPDTIKFYLNTTEHISTSHGSTSVSLSQGNVLLIGYNGQPGLNETYANCSIGAVYAYKCALTPEEIENNYNATKARYETVLASGLVAHLDASNTSSYSGSGSTWTDLTGNGNDGTINGATWSSTDGGIFDFDGVNDAIQIAHNSSLSLSTSTQKTIQVWVKFDALGATSTQQIPVFGKLSSSYAYDGYWGGLYGDTGTIRCTTNGAAIQRTSTSTLTVTTDTWYLFTFVSQITSTSNTTKVYINGTQYITTAHGSDSYTESNPLYLGYIGSGVGSLYLNGKIGACYFYTRGLSSDEVLQNFHATKSRYGVS